MICLLCRIVDRNDSAEHIRLGLLGWVVNAVFDRCRETL